MPELRVHIVALPAIDGGTLLVSLIDEGAMVHLRYGGSFATEWTPDRVADQLGAVTHYLGGSGGN